MTETPWYATRGFLASATLIGVVLISWAAAALIPSSEGRSPAPANAARADTGGSRCQLPAGSQDPVVGPPRATWKLVGALPAPAVPGIGPGITDEDGDRRCYQHSPTGALLAAANFLPVTATVRDHAKGMDHYAPGPVRDIYAKQPAPAFDPNTTVQTVGFRMTVISPDAVDVQLALRVNGTLGYAALPMRWSPPGDWRVQLQSVEVPLDAGRLESMAGYVKWSPPWE